MSVLKKMETRAVDKLTEELSQRVRVETGYGTCFKLGCVGWGGGWYLLKFVCSPRKERGGQQVKTS